MLARYLAEDDIRCGRLVPLLQEFPLASHWLKALVPRMKMNRPVVREFITFLKTRLEDASWAAPRQAALPAAHS